MTYWVPMRGSHMTLFIQSGAAWWCLHRCVMVFASSVREAGRVQAVILIRSVFVSSSIIHVIVLSAKRSHSFYDYSSSMAHFSELWYKWGSLRKPVALLEVHFSPQFTFSLLWCKNLIFINVIVKTIIYCFNLCYTFMLI